MPGARPRRGPGEGRPGQRAASPTSRTSPRSGSRRWWRDGTRARHDLVGRAARGRRDPDLPADPAHRAPRAGPVGRAGGGREPVASACAPATWSCWRAPPTRARPARRSRRCWSAPGLRAGRDFHLAFSPERVDPGPRRLDHRAPRRRWSAASRPRAPGGPWSSTATACETLVPVGSPEVAELTKLLENIFRSVNIALVNELAMLCDRMGIDVWEVIDAAATKPFGFMPFRPGPGPGRALHPDRPLLPHLEGARVRPPHRVHRAGREGQLADAPASASAKVARALNSQRKALNGSRVLVIGRGLQGERQRHAREPGAEGHRAAARRRRAGRVPRPARRRRCRSRAWRACRWTPRRSTRYDVGGGRDGPRRRSTGRWSAARRRWSSTCATWSRRSTARCGGCERGRDGGRAGAISLGVVGMNYWGPNLARNFARIEGCRLAWVCDRDEAVLARHRSAYPESRFTARYDDLLEDAATSTRSSSPPRCPRTRRWRGGRWRPGMDAFVEKPLALTAREANELAAAGRRARPRADGRPPADLPPGRAGGEGDDRRAGRLGRVFYLYGNRQNLGIVRPDENALWSLGPARHLRDAPPGRRAPQRGRRERRELPAAGRGGRGLRAHPLPLRGSSATCT